MTVLQVGAGAQYRTISSAIAASSDGDVVQVQAGTYSNDFAEIGKKITIEGVGGTAKLVATGPIPNGKGILITDTDVTIKNLEFSGATVNDGNGAGIRYQSGNLTVVNSYFHDNQNGLLTADNPSGSITIQNSEFSHNGTGDGYTHNLYVGDIGSLAIDRSYFHYAVVGHEIKSRAENTTITNSRIVDGPNGTASYSIDLPNGGNAVISNNVIEQGPNSQNPNIIAFGEEGNLRTGSSLKIVNDVILNELDSPSAMAVWNATSVSAVVDNISTYGLSPAQLLRGPGTVSGVTALSSEPAINITPPEPASPPISHQNDPQQAFSPPPGAPDAGTSVFRFFDTKSGTQFLTSSQTERATILATRPDLTSEGAGFDALANAPPGSSAVYRFFDTGNGTHFFTSSATERDQIDATRSDLIDEGVGFYEYAGPQPGAAPVYRFFDTAAGTHFYTASPSERAAILTSRPDLIPEGIAFYAPPTS